MYHQGQSEFGFERNNSSFIRKIREVARPQIPNKDHPRKEILVTMQVILTNQTTIRGEGTIPFHLCGATSKRI
jgi:hypothetical protein